MPDTTRNLRIVFARVCASLTIALLAGISLLVASDGALAYLTKQGIDHSSTEEIADAIRFNSRNALAYSARAAIYQDRGQMAEAITDLERATELRPGDQLLWLRLGFLRYVGGDMDGAIKDFSQATVRAPFYAQPRWYLGVARVESGQLEEGFRQIRLAVASDPTYAEKAIEYASQAYGGDPSKIRLALAPDNSRSRTSLARFFLRQNNIPEVLELAGVSGANLSAEDRQTLISDLLAANQFEAAYRLWQTPEARWAGPGLQPWITNGGFETDYEAGGRGFNWHSSTNLQRAYLQRDSAGPEKGSYCLRLDFNGASSPESALISQIVLVNGSSNYQIDFSFRSGDLVTGGDLAVQILDAKDDHLIAERPLHSKDEKTWTRHSLKFQTVPATTAIVIVITRQNCDVSPCPAFGHAWFDEFTISKI